MSLIANVQATARMLRQLGATASQQHIRVGRPAARLERSVDNKGYVLQRVSRIKPRNCWRNVFLFKASPSIFLSEDEFAGKSASIRITQVDQFCYAKFPKK
jgi:hypothetical protein